MFKTKEQINRVSKRTGVPNKYVKELGIMMSRVKLTQEEITLPNTNLCKALTYFEEEFLKCKLW